MEKEMLMTEFSDEATRMMASGAKEKDIETRLLEKGLDLERIRALLKNIKETRIRNDRSRGFLLIGIGAIMLVTSFFLTVMHFHADNSIDFVMYGLTVPGIILVMIGFKFIF